MLSTLLGMEFAATDVPAKISPAAEQALNVLQDNVFLALLVGAGVFLIGSGLAIVATGSATEVARLDRGRRSPILAVTPLGWLVAIFALPIWTLIVSVLMFLPPGGASRRPRRLPADRLNDATVAARSRPAAYRPIHSFGSRSTERFTPALGSCR